MHRTGQRVVDIPTCPFCLKAGRSITKRNGAFPVAHEARAKSSDCSLIFDVETNVCQKNLAPFG